MAFDRDEVLNKVYNLLQKTEERGCSVAEAAAAAEIVQRLCQKYNVTEAEAVARGVVEKSPLGAFIIEYPDNYHLILLGIIAKNMFCEVVVIQGTNEVYLIGTEMNDSVVYFLYGFVSTQLDATRIMDSVNGSFDCNLEDFDNSWWTGAINAIEQRLQKNQTIFEADNKALVNTSKTLVLDFINQNFGNSDRIELEATAFDYDAYQLGLDAGNAVQMNRSVGNSVVKAMPHSV